MSSKTLVIIDGHYYAYRYYFSLPGLTGPHGRPTGVTYSFAELFRSLRNDERVTHLALVLDHDGPNFRNEIYPAYKAQREPMPDDLRTQIPDLHRLAELNHVPIVCVPGYEADDVIAGLARQAAADGYEVLLCTNDKDLDQVIDERITIWDPTRDERRGPAELMQKKGIRPDQVVDYLMMVGDASDNVPGIKGVGAKTAVKLLQAYGDVETLLARSDELTGKRRENVKAFAQQVELSRRLITIPPVPDLPPIAGLAKASEPDPAARAFYEDLGFSVAKHFQEAERPASADSEYRILGAGELPDYLVALRNAGRFAIDCETTGLDPLTCELVGISFAYGEDCGHQAAYLPIRGTGPVGLVPLDEVVSRLGPLLADPAVGKVMQNGKYDLRVLAAHGMPIGGYDGDPLLASWLLDPGRSGHGLDYLTRIFLGETKRPIGAVIDLAAGQTMAEVPVTAVAEYACEDAHCTWRLARMLEALLAKEGLLDVYRAQELPLARVLAAIEDRGMPVDRTILAEKQGHLEDYLREVTRSIHAITGKGFNPASPKQVAAFLFGELGLPVIRKTRTGPSTDATVLEALRGEHELPGLLIQFRNLSKLLGTYAAKLPEHIHPVTGRIHTSLRQTGTETGRLASERPNLQNIPKRDDLGRELRAAFAVDAGRELLSADYSQIELRILAHYSGDPTLCEAFQADADIHRFVAARIHGLPEDEVTPRQRQAAKAINFGIIYGQTAFGLGQQLGIDRAHAQEFIDEYFARFAEVRGFIERLIASARQRGYVETIAGRRRYIPLLASRNRNEQMAGRRTALNSTIQGSAADLIKRAMLRCEDLLPDGARLVLQIHDELLVESDANCADAAAAALREAMTGAWRLSVPLTTDLHRAHDWLAISQ